MKQLYCDQFNNDPDNRASIENAVNSSIFIAVIVLCGEISKTKQLPPKGKHEPKSPVQHSIMSLTTTDEIERNNIPKVVCVAGVTFLLLPLCQFIHWLATQKSKVPGSDYHSWHN